MHAYDDMCVCEGNATEEKGFKLNFLSWRVPLHSPPAPPFVSQSYKVSAAKLHIKPTKHSAASDGPHLEEELLDL